jgi:hypothetical protein
MFLRNVGSYKTHTALEYPRKQHFSYSEVVRWQGVEDVSAEGRLSDRGLQETAVTEPRNMGWDRHVALLARRRVSVGFWRLLGCWTVWLL